MRRAGTDTDPAKSRGVTDKARFSYKIDTELKSADQVLQDVLRQPLPPAAEPCWRAPVGLLATTTGTVPVAKFDVQAPGTSHMKVSKEGVEALDTLTALTKSDDLSARLRMENIGVRGAEAAFYDEWQQAVTRRADQTNETFKAEAKTSKFVSTASNAGFSRKPSGNAGIGPLLHASEGCYSQPMPSVLPHAIEAAIESRERKLDAAASKLTKKMEGELSRAGYDPRKVDYDTLLKTEIPEADPTSVLEGLPGEKPAHTATGGTVRDEEGKLIQWGWLAGHGPHGPAHVWTIPGARPKNPIDDLIQRGLDAATADGNRGRNKTGVRAWFSFCEDEGKSAHRPMDPLTPLWAKLDEEWLAMRFVAALVQVRGISPASASVYWSQVQGWHAREFGIKIAAGMKLERLPQMLKGLRRIFGDIPPTIRRGIAPQALRRAMDMMLDPDKPEHANIRAALSTAFVGLLRSAEFALDYGKVWDSEKNLNRADLALLTEEQAIIMMHPCKNMHILTGKTVPLVLGAGGEYIDAVWELNNLIRVDPIAEHLKKSTPLFRNPADNQPLRTSSVRDWTKGLMKAIGEDPTEFGTHSYRIGGATALFAAGADPTVIRTMGRWSSDCYRLYVRACHERCQEWTRRAGSMRVTDKVLEFDEVDHY